MFLAVTADERYWRTGEKILFLGEWCKRFSRRHVWSALDHETLPYHWDDRALLHRDYLRLRRIYEQRLRLISGQLNAAHGTAHSERYWRILVGPWLSHFIEVLYDRYASIEAVASREPGLHTLTIDTSSSAWTPGTYADFLRRSNGDQYNLYLYSCILERIRSIPYERAEAPRLESPPPGGIGPLRRLANGLSRLVPDERNRVVMVSSYLSRSQQVKIQAALGQAPYYVSEPTPGAARADLGKRASLWTGDDGAGFESVLGALIPRQLPSAYLEGYASLRERALDFYPRNPRVIYTANAYATQELFKAWCAEQRDAGAFLCIAQHGGHHGTGAWSSAEEHELAISDRYYTWGWDDPESEKCRPLSPGPLLRACQGVSSSTQGGILWVPMSVPRYSYWMYSIPVGPQVLGYLEEQRRFHDALGERARSLLTLRLFPHEFGWDEEERWKEWAPDLRLYRGSQPFLKQLASHRLLVGTYNSTTFLETFVANYPTVLFWNPAFWELRRAAAPFFDLLRNAGILHDTPESAARKIDEICADPLRWWRGDAVQQARAEFCGQFARIRPDWLAEWKAELAGLAESPRA
jgi:putative transferase (TIGR04331 family)